MIIVSMTSYPTESAVEVGKRFVELPAIPDYINRRGPYINSNVGKGIQAITIYEVDDARYSDAFNFLMEWHTKMFGIPGYTFSLDQWLEARDALKLVGIK